MKGKYYLLVWATLSVLSTAAISDPDSKCAEISVKTNPWYTVQLRLNKPCPNSPAQQNISDNNTATVRAEVGSSVTLYAIPNGSGQPIPLEGPQVNPLQQFAAYHIACEGGMTKPLCKVSKLTYKSIEGQ